MKEVGNAGTPPVIIGKLLGGHDHWIVHADMLNEFAHLLRRVVVFGGAHYLELSLKRPAGE